MTSSGHHDHAVAEFLHSHEFGQRDREGERRTAWVMWLTILTMVVEIAAGWLTGSMALLADGWHMGTHATAMGIAWAAFVYARRHARDRRFTFGTGKVGILAAFGSAVVLGGVALLMFWESGLRLLHPAPIRFNEALAVAVVGLTVNVVSAWVLGRPGKTAHDSGDDHHHADGHGHHHHHDHNLRAAYLHVIADAMTSVLAIVALLAARQWHWMWADPLMGIVGGAVILRWAWGLARETGHILTDGDIAPEELEAIRRTVESDGDSRLTDLHVWRVGTTEKAAILCVVAREKRSPAQYRERLRRFPDLRHISVEVNACAECADEEKGRKPSGEDPSRSG